MLFLLFLSLLAGVNIVAVGYPHHLVTPTHFSVMLDNIIADMPTMRTPIRPDFTFPHVLGQKDGRNILTICQGLHATTAYMLTHFTSSPFNAALILRTQDS
jgi:hypothetical protein